MLTVIFLSWSGRTRYVNGREPSLQFNMVAKEDASSYVRLMQKIILSWKLILSLDAFSKAKRIVFAANKLLVSQHKRVMYEMILNWEGVLVVFPC